MLEISLLDPPSPPRKPTEVSGMSESSLTLAWQASEKDGGSKIIEYIVEIKETNKETWTRCGTTIGDRTNIHIENLVMDMSYEFRICARNEAGTSAYLETEDKIIVGRKISKCFIDLNLFGLEILFEIFYIIFLHALFHFQNKTFFLLNSYFVMKLLRFCFTSGWSIETCK